MCFPIFISGLIKKPGTVQVQIQILRCTQKLFPQLGEINSELQHSDSVHKYSLQLRIHTVNKDGEFATDRWGEQKPLLPEYEKIPIV